MANPGEHLNPSTSGNAKRAARRRLALCLWIVAAAAWLAPSTAAAQPRWDDDDYLVAHEGLVDVYDHDFTFKGTVANSVFTIGSIAWTPEGWLRTAAEGAMLDMGRADSGPGSAYQYRYINFSDAMGQLGDIKFAPDGAMFVGMTGGGPSVRSVRKYLLGPDQPAGGPYAVVEAQASMVGWWSANSLHYGVAVVPDDRYGYVVWAGTEDLLRILQPDLSEIPFGEGGVVLEGEAYTVVSMHYDPSSHTVLAGREVAPSPSGTLVAVELDAEALTIVRRFRLPYESSPVFTHLINGITRGENGIVVAADSGHGRIHIWNADGTYVRSFDMERNVVGHPGWGERASVSIIWAGNRPVPPPVDTTAPTTTITLSAPAPDGLNGWYVSPVRVVVSAADDTAGSGVDETRCMAIDSGTIPPSTFAALPAGCAYTGAGADIVADGIRTIHAGSRDVAGNIESPLISTSLRIDRTPPAIACQAPSPEFPLNTHGAMVHGDVTDVLSGPAWHQVSAAADTSSVGQKTLVLNAVDRAGNSASTSCGYSVVPSDTDPPTDPPTNDDAPPAISGIADQNIDEDTTTAALPFTIGDVDTALAQLTLSATSSDQVLVPDANIVIGGSDANRTITVVPAANRHGGPVAITVTVSDGAHASSTTFFLTVTPADAPAPTALTYYLAEGATGTFFDEDLLIANPNTIDAPVTVTFYREGLSSVSETRTIPAGAGTALRVDELPGLESAAASVQVSSDAGLPLAVERTQFWDATSYAGHSESAVAGPSTRWYFAEGAQGYFDTFVLVANPQAVPVDVTLTFPREGESTVTTTVQVAPFSRKTISTASIPDLVGRAFGIIVDATQPVVAERAMYFGTTATRLWSGGGASAGATAPSTAWYFAEAATGSFFDTFILLMNPDDADAHVTLRYLLETGETIDVEKVVPRRGRLTVNIETESDARLHAASMSTLLTSDRPIVAERSVYWPTAEEVWPWGESHNSLGATAAGPRWALAEGRTGGTLNFQTYILLANFGAQPAEVTARFQPDSGAPVVKTYVVPPTSRVTVNVTTEAPELEDRAFVTLITTEGDAPIVAERSLYWDGAGLTWSGGSNVVATRLPDR